MAAERICITGALAENFVLEAKELSLDQKIMELYRAEQLRILAERRVEIAGRIRIQQAERLARHTGQV